MDELEVCLECLGECEVKKAVMKRSEFHTKKVEYVAVPCQSCCEGEDNG